MSARQISVDCEDILSSEPLPFFAQMLRAHWRQHLSIDTYEQGNSLVSEYFKKHQIEACEKQTTFQRNWNGIRNPKIGTQQRYEEICLGTKYAITHPVDALLDPEMCKTPKMIRGLIVRLEEGGRKYEHSYQHGDTPYAQTRIALNEIACAMSLYWENVGINLNEPVEKSTRRIQRTWLTASQKLSPGLRLHIENRLCDLFSKQFLQEPIGVSQCREYGNVSFTNFNFTDEQQQALRLGRFATQQATVMDYGNVCATHFWFSEEQASVLRTSMGKHEIPPHWLNSIAVNVVAGLKSIFSKGWNWVRAPHTANERAIIGTFTLVIVGISLAYLFGHGSPRLHDTVDELENQVLAWLMLITVIYGFSDSNFRPWLRQKGITR